MRDPVSIAGDVSVRRQGFITVVECAGGGWRCSTADESFACEPPPLEEAALPRYLDRLLGSSSDPRRVEFVSDRYALPQCHGSRLLAMWTCPVTGVSPVSAAIARWGGTARIVVLARLDDGIAEVLEVAKDGERRVRSCHPLPDSIAEHRNDVPESLALRACAAFGNASLAYGVPSDTAMLFVGGCLADAGQAARFNAVATAVSSRAERRALALNERSETASTHRAKLSNTSRLNVSDDGRLRLTVQRETSYSVLRAPKPLFELDAPLLAEAIGDRPVFVVIDCRVDATYGTALRTYAARNVDCTGTLVVSPREEDKTLAAVEAICAAANASGLPRDGVLLGIGGGVTLDQAGLAAALYRRGVLFSRVPTTLVGMVDVGVGIKQGVNAEQKKNFLGAFYPAFVNIVDVAFLATLPRRHIASGMAEVAKMAIICDPRLFDLLECDGPSLVRGRFAAHRSADEVIARAQLSMMAELSDNLYEEERARTVDFGHTFSPMLETATGYALSHGAAVAIDMVLSTAIAVELGLCEAAVLARLTALLRSLSLPIVHEGLNRARALAALAAACKHRGRPEPRRAPRHRFGHLRARRRYARPRCCIRSNRSRAMSVLAVDLGGTFLRAALLDDDGGLESITRRRLRTVFDGRTPNDVWTDIIDGIAEAARSTSARDARHIAMAFPGPISGSTPLCAPTLTGDAPVPIDLAARIERRSGKPLRMLNDVSAAASYVASATNDSSFLIITVSSGIGSRIYRRGSARSRVAYDGEIGHLIIDTDPAAPVCDCGGHGHLGAIASGRAFERLARSTAAADPMRFAASIWGAQGVEPEALENERHLVPAICAGDAWSRALLRRSIAPLARLAFQIVVASGLERIYVIGGFATAVGEVYRDLFQSELERQIDSPALHVELGDLVRVLQPDTEATLRGAALMS